MQSQLGPTLHVHTCRVTVSDIKNGCADNVQIWYTDRDRLVGCRLSQLEAHPRSSTRAGLNLPLARSSPQKASYGSQCYSPLFTCPLSFSARFDRCPAGAQPGSGPTVVWSQGQPAATERARWVTARDAFAMGYRRVRSFQA